MNERDLLNFKSKIVDVDVPDDDSRWQQLKEDRRHALESHEFVTQTGPASYLVGYPKPLPDDYKPPIVKSKDDVATEETLEELLIDEEFFDLNEQAAFVREWQEQKFSHVTQLHRGLSLSEEVGEVNRFLLKRDQNIRVNTRGDLAEELGDALSQILAIASAEGFDIYEIISANRAKLERLRTINLRDK